MAHFLCLCRLLVFLIATNVINAWWPGTSFNRPATSDSHCLHRLLWRFRLSVATSPYLIHRLCGFVSLLNPTSSLPETFTRKHTETNTREARPTDHRFPVPTHHTTRKKACSAQRGRCFICDRHVSQHTQLPPFETAQSSQHGGIPQFKSTSVHPATNSHRVSPHFHRDVLARLLVRSPRSASEHSPWTKPIAVTLPSSLRDSCFARPTSRHR